MKVNLDNFSDAMVDELVVIKGTDFDRKRKILSSDICRIKSLISLGYSLQSIADAFGVKVSTIKYNIDSQYRAASIASKSGKHYGDSALRAERVAYKRSIMEAI